MGPEKLTSSDKDWLRDMYLNMPAAQLGEILMVSKSVVARYLRESGLKVPKETTNRWKAAALTGRTTSTPEIDAVLKAYYLSHTQGQLEAMTGKSSCFVTKRLGQLGLVIPEHVRAERKLLTTFKEGQAAFNKGKKQPEYMDAECIARTEATRFKAGGTSARWRGVQDGDISKRKDKNTGRVYQWTRISRGNWRMLHVVNWAAQHGPVPEGYIVVFRDGDTMNCEVTNLELLTLAENMARNTIQRYPDELKSAIKLISKLKKAIDEKQNR